MAILEIKTADEFIALDSLARQAGRRAARQTRLFRWVLQTFVDRGGPIPVRDIVAAAHDRPAEAIQDALVALDNDDLIRIRDGHVDIAYPLSAVPTPFLVRLPGGRTRYACCAMDALGMAPMIGERVEIRARCHHCEAPLELSATPTGPGLDADGVMLWLGKRTEDRCRVADSL